MLLTITNTHTPATDLGYLLHKNPKNTHTVDLPFGRAHAFYPEAHSHRCTIALLLEVDPIGLIRGRWGTDRERLLDQYVNDRPYVASSFLSVALAALFRTALSGKSKERPELANTPLPFEVSLSSLPCRGGEPFLRRLFEPLGYSVTCTLLPLDPKFPEWGKGSYFRVQLKHTIRLQELLQHLYVLIPVLDDKKHYWVGEDEIDKLLRHGEGWLAAHPHAEQITRRYLNHRHALANAAMIQLAHEDTPAVMQVDTVPEEREADLEHNIDLQKARMLAVLNVLKEHDVKRIADLGCGEGKFLRYLVSSKYFTEIVGMDVSLRSLQIAAKRLKLDKQPENDRIKLIQGSLMYQDKRLQGFEGAALIEVIEHLDLPKLSALERVVFECAKPKVVVVTTPNREYNAKFSSLPAGQFRHQDHRFEWTRAEFESWARTVANQRNYSVFFSPIGDVDEELGAPTQMGVFTLCN